jgi:hypothetical protein
MAIINMRKKFGSSFSAVPAERIPSVSKSQGLASVFLELLALWGT